MLVFKKTEVHKRIVVNDNVNLCLYVIHPPKYLSDNVNLCLYVIHPPKYLWDVTFEHEFQKSCNCFHK